ncbi:hypothetical protein [Parasediminibacterium sp. JCM 36343]|uniref:hypothetical protein n=1 Tax=Parasediminibacterium sp. JCM 36343 TaxID=3374279 RepID=UPI00397A9E3D
MEYPSLFWSQNLLGTKAALMATDASLQLFEKHSINPIQVIGSTFGPLTYSLSGATTFNYNTFSVGIDQNASVSTVAVSTIANMV